MKSRLVRRLLFVLVLAAARPAAAQTEVVPAPAQLQEDLEPRIVGAPGATAIGFAGFVDRFTSSEKYYPLNYTVQIDISRFVTRRIAVRGGVEGSGSTGGDEETDTLRGNGAAAINAGVGGLFYFTPQSMVSAYSGLEYWAQVTRRESPDAGSIVGLFGLQAAASSRASFFVEGGYGINLTRGDESQTITRIVGRVGFRFRF